jgi:hypothetical protein
VRDLYIDASFSLPGEKDDMDPIPLLEFFRPFVNVKSLFLANNVEHYVGYALNQEMATGALPNTKVIRKSLSASSIRAVQRTVNLSRLNAIRVANPRVEQHAAQPAPRLGSRVRDCVIQAKAQMAINRGNSRANLGGQ